MNDDELLGHLTAAVELVEGAGPIALRYFRTAMEVDNKSEGVSFDPVTRADREVEAELREGLGRLYPSYEILGEEEGLSESGSGRRWILDPIDGTRAFISGMPAWGILLGLVEEDSCLVGAMHQPFLGETFCGSPLGSSLRCHGKAERSLRTRATTSLSAAILYSTHPSMFADARDRRAFDRVADRCRMLRYGGDCYSYCLLAMGQIDLIIEACLQPYDIAPLIPIVEGAGGVVTNFEGGSAHRGGRVVAAATPRLHQKTLEILNRSSETD